MTRRPLPSLRVLAPGIAGLILEAAAFAVETAMGSGYGPRYAPVHLVQLTGAALILLTTLLIAFGNNRKPR